MSAELEDIHEECGIFGVWGHPDASRLTYFGLHALQHRGQEGAGIVSNDNGHLIGHRGLGLLTQVFGDEREIERLKGNCAIGHVRYATAGSGTTDNIQPFIFRFHDGDMALCHNGNLTNCPSLRRKLEDEGAIFHSNSDTEVLMHLIRRSMQRTFMDKLKEALNTVHGGFAYLLMTEDAMIGALDPNGFRPLSLGKMKNGAYVLASETCALDVVGAELVRNIRPGEIVVVNDHGYKIVQYTNNTQLAICSMEYIYFARPDSDIYGVNVHSARKRMGARLAAESPVEADMVIGVPNSSLSAASGYAEAAGLPNEMGLIKNQYVARTFIQPTQELREQGVREHDTANRSGRELSNEMRLFDRWDAAAGAGQPRWRDFGDVYQATEDERYRLLFEQVCHLLVQPSAFNQAMPQEFRATARQWLAGRASGTVPAIGVTG